MNIARHGRGTIKNGKKVGGQFAPHSQASDIPLDASDLTLQDASTAVNLRTESSYDEPVWGDKPILDFKDLRSYTNEQEHHDIACGQQAHADTAAELWHIKGGLSSREVQTHLRNVTDARRPLEDLEMQMAESLQKSIMASDLDEPCVVYRAIHSEQGNDGAIRYLTQLEDMAGAGDTIKGEGFWSASTDPSVVQSFLGTFPKRVVIFRIETTKGKFLPSSSNRTPKDTCGFFQEKEVVLPHGASYEILDKQQVSVNPALDATVISMRFVGVDPTEETLPSLQKAGNPASQSMKSMARHIKAMLSDYKKVNLPVGAHTYDIETYIDDSLGQR